VASPPRLADLGTIGHVTRLGVPHVAVDDLPKFIT
jgi:hypothetical protein